MSQRNCNVFLSSSDCAPSASSHIIVEDIELYDLLRYDGLSCVPCSSGYDCYNCSFCSPGSHSSEQGTCVKCPAGTLFSSVQFLFAIVKYNANYNNNNTLGRQSKKQYAYLKDCFKKWSKKLEYKLSLAEQKY